MTLLFCYGSLMRDRHAHHIIETFVDFEGAASLPNARLFNCGPFPALKLGGFPKSIVHGELFRVKLESEREQMFRNLDWYEGAPDLFKREQVSVKIGPPKGDTGGDRVVWATTYVFAGKLGANDVLIPDGRW